MNLFLELCSLFVSFGSGINYTSEKAEEAIVLKEDRNFYAKTWCWIACY